MNLVSFRIVPTAFCALLLAACSSHGSSAVPPLSPAAQQAHARVSKDLTVNGGVTTATGQITSVSPDGLTFGLNTGICGNVNVVMGSMTQLIKNGLAVQTGVYADVTGTGDCSSSSISASVVSLSSSASFSSAGGSPVAAGTIASVYSGGFSLNAGSTCGYVNVATGGASLTANGLSLAAGTPAQVYGSGSCATSYVATQVVLGSAASANTFAPLVSGTINSVSGNQISMYAGAPCGNVNVNYSSSTPITYNGQTLGAGTPIEVAGNGSCATSITASAIVLGFGSPPAAGSPLVSGTINSAAGGAINMYAGSACGNINVVYSSSTSIAYNGYSLSAGTPIAVSGSGTCSTTITATQITLGASSAPTSPPQQVSSSAAAHIITADYLGGYAGTHSVAWSSAAPYLSWAETGTADSIGIHAAGIKTLDYMDPNRIVPGEQMWTSDESAFAHDCSGNRITRQYSSTQTQYLMNPAASSMLSDWVSAANSDFSNGQFDAVFEDDANNLYGMNATPCSFSADGWMQSTLSEIQSFGRPVFENGIALGNSMGLLAASNLLGGVSEECYTHNSQPTPPYIPDGYWVQSENLELSLAAQGKTFVCYNTDFNAASSEIAPRLYNYASFLLSYTLSSSMLWENFSTPSGVHVEPETALVALNPTVSQPSSIGSLQASGGAYAREYGACYIGGTSIGPCAAVVNPSSTSSAPFPLSGYSHTLVLSGGGVLDGGTISTRGGPPPASMGPLTAAIVFP